MEMLVPLYLRGFGRASRLVRKILVLVGQPVLRTRAFQVPASVLTMVAIFLTPKAYRCTGTVLNLYLWTIGLV